MKQFGIYRLDTRNQCLWRGPVQLSVAPRPYGVLRYLVEHPGRLIAHDELMDALWPETYVQPQVLRTYVLDLRKLLGDDAADPKFIATIRKRGYCFLAAVSEASVSGPAEMDPSRTPSGPGMIVGRGDELRKLHSLMQQADAGERQIVFLTGEAGIGKSALLDAFCAQIGSEARVARGQALVHFGSREPLYPVQQMLKELIATEGRDLDHRSSGARSSSGAQKARSLLAHIASVWSASAAERANADALAASPVSTGVPATGVMAAPKPTSGSTRHPAEAFTGNHRNAIAESTAHTTDSPAAPHRSVSELCDALEAVSREFPLLLVLEDLHWADEGTLDFLSAIARYRTPARLMVIATCRPTGKAPGRKLPVPIREGESPSTGQGGERNGARSSVRALLQDLSMRRLCTVIGLEPLSLAAVAEYVSFELRRRIAADPVPDSGHSGAKENPIPPELAPFLHRESNGSPLFLSAILDHLIASHILVARGGQWTLRKSLAQVELGVPEPLREMIELDVEALDESDQRLAEAAAIAAGVAGAVFPVWAAAAVLNADTTDVEAPTVEERFEQLTGRIQFLKPAGHDELPDGARSTSYVFTHHFYRDVLYARQPGARRSRGHQRLAAALARIFAGSVANVAAEIASHYEAAGDWSRAAEMLARMAAHSAAGDDREDARKLLARGLDLLENLGARERAPLERELREKIKALGTAPAPDRAGSKSAPRKAAPAAAPARSTAKSQARPAAKSAR